MIRISAALLLLALSGSVAATVYRCEVNGEIIFSQLPCAEDAEEFELKVPRPATPPPSEVDGAEGEAQAGAAGAAAGQDDTFLDRKRIEREIAANLRKRERLEAERDSEINKLKKKARATTSKLRGAELELEAVGIEDKYNKQIIELDKERKELEKSRDQL